MQAKTTTRHRETVIAAGREYVCEFRAQRHGGYVVTSRMFLPLIAYAETLEEARLKAREGIEAWIEYADCREFA